jgi:hypothetical protein
LRIIFSATAALSAALVASKDGSKLGGLALVAVTPGAVLLDQRGLRIRWRRSRLSRPDSDDRDGRQRGREPEFPHSRKVYGLLRLWLD